MSRKQPDNFNTFDPPSPSGSGGSNLPPRLILRVLKHEAELRSQKANLAAATRRLRDDPRHDGKRNEVECALRGLRNAEARLARSAEKIRIALSGGGDAS